MKRVLYAMCILSLLTGCNNIEKQAAVHLEAARKAYEQGDYSQAKLQIDSIKINYPKAFETRREGNRLRRLAELKEQERSLVYLDSMLQARQAEFNAIKEKFVFEKDTAYQETGNYLHPSQVIEKNLHRSFLRFQTDERGNMSLTSIYCGSRNIHHTAVKVSTTDGSFAQTPPSKDSYETSNLGEQIEKANFKLGEDGNIIGFLYMNRDKRIRVEYLGEHPYTTTLSATDLQAASSVYELAQILSSITEINKHIEEARLKIRFLTKEE